MKTARAVSIAWVCWLAAALAGHATDYVSTASGNWTSPSTWGGSGWPQNPADTATIANGHTVTISANVPSIAAVTIQPSGTLLLNASGVSGDRVATTQTVTLANGATIRSDGDYQQSDVGALYGTIAVSGTANFQHGFGYLSLYSAISGTGTLAFQGYYTGNGYIRTTRLYGDNSGFNGDVTIGAQSTKIEVFHRNAFGSKTNLVITIPATSGQENSGIFLYSSAAPLATNLAEIVAVGGPARCGTFYQSQGTVVSNRITLLGGTYAFVSGGSGNRVSAGEIVLGGSQPCTFDRGNTSGGVWIQTGVISGTGGVYIIGYNANDAVPSFNGNNTYSGGTYVEKKTGQLQIYAGHNNAFGSGPVQLAADSDTRDAFQITGNLAMPNDFRGRGKVLTGNYVLTATGAISPRDTGLTTRTKGIGTLCFEDLQVGSATQGCTYYWQYNATSSDLVACDTLQFGAALNTLQAEWLGAGSAPLGDYPIMTFGGTPPSAGNWRVVHSAGLKGRVWVDSANSCVRVKFWRAGTVVALR